VKSNKRNFSQTKQLIKTLPIDSKGPPEILYGGVTCQYLFWLLITDCALAHIDKGVDFDLSHYSMRVEATVNFLHLFLIMSFF